MIDVSAAVQRWANGEANYGFAIVPEIISGNDDGITIWSSKNGNALYRPVLDVTYFVNRSIPAPGGLAILAMAACWSTRRSRHHTALLV